VESSNEKNTFACFEIEKETVHGGEGGRGGGRVVNKKGQLVSLLGVFIDEN